MYGSVSSPSSRVLGIYGQERLMLAHAPALLTIGSTSGTDRSKSAVPGVALTRLGRLAELRE